MTELPERNFTLAVSPLPCYNIFIKKSIAKHRYAGEGRNI